MNCSCGAEVQMFLCRMTCPRCGKEIMLESGIGQIADLRQQLAAMTAERDAALELINTSTGQNALALGFAVERLVSERIYLVSERNEAIRRCDIAKEKISRMREMLDIVDF